MFKHVYKAGGDWKDAQGRDYTIKAVNFDEFSTYLAKGWYEELEDAFAIDGESSDLSVDGGQYERDLRDKIKDLGGKPAGRSSIETLEAQLRELEDGDNN